MMPKETIDQRLRGLEVAIEMLDIEAMALGMNEVAHFLGCARMAIEERQPESVAADSQNLRLVHSRDR